MDRVIKMTNNKPVSTADQLQEELITILKKFQEYRDSETYQPVAMALEKAIKEIHRIRLNEITEEE